MQMETVLALVFLFCLGAGLGTVSRGFITKLWLASHASAALGTVLWVGGVYVFFWITAPGEMGPPVLMAIAFAYILMFIAAAVAIQAAEARDAHKNPRGTALPKKPDDGE